VKARWWLLGAVAALALRTCTCRSEPPPPERIRFATFNIEDFPKDDRQVTGAFDEIARLGASFVGLQEIVETDRFERGMREHLGPSWDVAFEPSPRHPNHHLGVLFDRRVWSFVSSRTHDGTRLEGRHKATLEVRLRSLATGHVVRALVIHFKSGREGRPIRVRQYAALAPIVRDAQASGERVVVLGDFNATGPDDRDDLASLATATGLTWATEQLACTAFWERDDGCLPSRLDHILTAGAPAFVDVGGACATDGCEEHDRCPLYHDVVSDHCPVAVSLP